jgi:hypothetical protein
MNCHFRLLFPFLLLVAGCFGDNGLNKEKALEKTLDKALIDVGIALENCKNLHIAKGHQANAAL